MVNIFQFHWFKRSFGCLRLEMPQSGDLVALLMMTLCPCLALALVIYSGFNSPLSAHVLQPEISVVINMSTSNYAYICNWIAEGPSPSNSTILPVVFQISWIMWREASKYTTLSVTIVWESHLITDQSFQVRNASFPVATTLQMQMPLRHGALGMMHAHWWLEAPHSRLLCIVCVSENVSLFIVDVMWPLHVLSIQVFSTSHCPAPPHFQTYLWFYFPPILLK